MATNLMMATYCYKKIQFQMQKTPSYTLMPSSGKIFRKNFSDYFFCKMMGSMEKSFFKVCGLEIVGVANLSGLASPHKYHKCLVNYVAN